MGNGGRHRQYMATVLVAVVIVTAIFAVDAMRSTDRYRSHVDFAMEVPLPAAHWDPEIAALSPEQTINRAVAFAEGAEVQGAIADELTYEHTLDVEAVDDHTLRFTTEAAEPDLAANAATAAASIYGQHRERDAQQAATAVLPELQAAADTATGVEREDALRRLHAAQDTIDLGPAGGPTADAPVPCCPVDKPLLAALLRGAAIGLLVGLLLAGIWYVDRRFAAQRRSRHGEGEPGASRWAAPWVGPTAVAGLVGLRALYYAVLGPRLMLDDWLLISRGRVYGVAKAVPEVVRTAQPTKWAWLTLVFGVSHGHPLVVFAFVTLANVAAAVALYYAVRRFFPDPIPLLVAGLWVLTANHSSLTVWAAASQAVVCVAFACGGITLLSKGRWLTALLAFTASTLAYEFTIPICMAASVLIGTRWLRARPGLPVVRTVRPWQRATMVAWLFVIVWWTYRHPKYAVAYRPPDLWDTWSAHVSTGLLATESASTLLLHALEIAVTAGIVWCAIAWLRGDRRRDRGPSLTLAGLAIMALGLVTTIVLPGLTIGVSNRLYGASGAGTAMVLAGIVVTLWHRRATLGLVAASGLVGVCLVGQVITLRAAHQGGQDVLAMLRYLPTVADDPANTRFVVAPRPEHDGFYAVDQYFGGYVYKLTYPDGTGDLRIATSQADFDAHAPDEVQVTWEEIPGR